ncbi:MAG: hypothetical protein DRQ55_14250 [Planctomycetota bacterium]|nr:MAG: hypothetical protein DRQ55_14250 [Planctomycetota bacterium]
MDLDISLHLAHWRLFVVVLTVLAAGHAHVKVSPFFAITWFGAAALFGWFWADGRGGPAVVLLPGLVVYSAAAITKGLVERRASLSGAHSLHVVLTGLLSGLLALPFESLARAMGWPLPRPTGRVLLGVEASWMGGVTLDTVASWGAAGFLLYGVYKVLDHIGLPRWLQVPALLGSMPFVASAAVWLHGRV